MPSPSADELRRMANGYKVSQAIHVAATLGIADLLRDGPRTSHDLAEHTQTHQPSLYRVLRALAGLNIFHEPSENLFTLAPLGEFLRSDSPHPVGPWAVYIGQPYFWQAWGNLLHTVRTGETAFNHVHGTDVWTYRSQHPAAGALFDRAMTAQTLGILDALRPAYDFSWVTTLVDVGGGEGTLLAQLMSAYPNMRGILFDQPEVAARARSVLEKEFAQRCEFVGGSFFDSVPAGADVYLMKYILHDWDDAPAIEILKTCRRACGSQSRLVVLDRVIDPSSETAVGNYFFDLNMLVMLGGKERTVKEFTDIFAAAGFRLERTTPTEALVSVIEGTPSAS